MLVIGTLQLFKLLCFQFHALLIVAMLARFSFFVLDANMQFSLRNALTGKDHGIGLRVGITSGLFEIGCGN